MWYSHGKRIIADKFVRKGIMSITNTRKLSNSITSFGPCLCMISFYFCDEKQKVLSILTILTYLACSGFGYGSGYVVNFNDIIPMYSGFVFGIVNTFSSLAGVWGNMIAAIVLKESTLSNWRPLFILFSIVYFLAGVVYLPWGSALPEKWAEFPANAPNDEEVPMQDVNLNEVHA
ncbi:unnamed protein product [Didymodactylos carnosus]|uniref:Inorganic phosphate cotransporter n=1 Tax=Didymodactylos carnosus TaxID=1234261 RepID=A0A8S2VPF6_9BILA|nr:unnamed protein product [Didymodactylos carnosus]CAF4410919.1 unnamed protein product [Didymodactylos carnosus]